MTQAWRTITAALASMVTLLAVVFLMNDVHAATVPSIINYQGKYIVTSTAVTTTDVMRYQLFDASGGGNVLYSASGTAVSPQTTDTGFRQGVFQVDFGGSGTNVLNPAFFTTNTNVYLELQASGILLSPRRQFTAMPYALNVNYLGGDSPDTASTSQYIVQSDANGNVFFTGDPQNSTVSGGVVYINPASAATDETLIGIANNDSEAFRVDAEGDMSIAGDLTTTGTTTLVTTSVNGEITADIGITITSNTPLSTTSQKLYTLGNTLYWSGQQVSMGSGLSWSTTAVPTAGLSATGDSSGAGLGADGSGAVWITSGGGISMYASTTGAVGIATSTLASGSILTIAGTSTLYAFLPDSDLSYDLGSSALLFNTLYVNTQSIGTSSWQFAQRGDDVLTITNTTATTVPALRFTSTNTAIFGGDMYTTSTNVNTGELIVGSSGGSVGITINGDRITAWPVLSGSVTTDTTWATTTDAGAIYHATTTDNVVIASSSQNVAARFGTTSFQAGDSNTFAGTTTINDFLYVPGRIDGPSLAREISGTSVSTTGGFYSQSMTDMVAHGDYLYITGTGGIPDGPSQNGLTIFDISDPENPEVLSGVSTTPPGGFSYLDIEGDLLYVAGNFFSPISVYDITNRENPILLSSMRSDYRLVSVTSMRIEGSYAYLTGTNFYDSSANTLYIIDISDIHNMEILATRNIDSDVTPTFSTTRDMHIRDGYLYMTYDGGSSNDRPGAIVYDVRNPETINRMTVTQLGSAITFQSITGNSIITDNYWYITQRHSSNGGYVQVLDISNKNSFTVVDTLSSGEQGMTSSYPGQTVLENNILTIFDIVSFGFTVNALRIDASDPTSLSFIETTSVSPAPGFITELQVQGNYYIFGLTNNVAVFNGGALKASTAQLGTVEANRLTGGLGAAFIEGTAQISSGLNVGQNLHVYGDSSFMPLGGPWGTTTWSFTNPTTFRTYSTSTIEPAFVFETQNFFSSSTSNVLFSVRNSSTPPAMSISSNGDLRAAGNLFASSTTIGTPGNPGDLAEQVDVLPEETVAPGDVMMVDPTGRDRYRKATTAYSSPVAGVISTQPNIVIGDGKTDYKAHLALVGRVPVKFSTENGPANAGDLLVPASIPGYAMVYNPAIAPTSTNIHVIGIALEASNSQETIYTLLQPSALTSRTQTDLSELQLQVQALSSGLSETKQTITVNQQTNTLTQITSDLDFGGFALLNTLAINSDANTWRITEEGYLETTVEGTDTKLRTVHSNNTQALFSGEGVINRGRASVIFSEDMQLAIGSSTYQVIITTRTSTEVSAFVQGKHEAGFIVTVDDGGLEDLPFDWMVVANKQKRQQPTVETATTTE